MCTAFSLSNTPSSVVTDPQLTAHFQQILPLAFFPFTRYLNPLRIRAGAPLAVAINSIMAGSISPQEYKMLIYTTAS